MQYNRPVCHGGDPMQVLRQLDYSHPGPTTIWHMWRYLDNDENVRHVQLRVANTAGLNNSHLLSDYYCN